MAETGHMEISQDLASKVIELVEIARNSGKIRRGMNEVTKVVEKGQAKVVLIATDVSPPEIAMHLPILCNEKKVPYIKFGTKIELGEASGLDVPTSALAVLEEGKAKDLLKTILKK
jgi:large subunit ribosomal protein L7Ae